jgi:hypothetical protein
MIYRASTVRYLSKSPFFGGLHVTLTCCCFSSSSSATDALLRVVVHSLVANGQISNRDATAFDVNINSNVDADYFDTSNKLWKELLVDPWEISIKGRRGANRGSSLHRMSTTLDTESFPCHLSFSEEFLMSLASANRMWSVYSLATTSAVETMNPSIDSSRLKRSMAASAARTLVTSLPYAAENHSGIEVEFLVYGTQDRRKCSNGSMEYFRFPPPKGQGSGGSRMYGQDLTYMKSVKLFVGDFSIDLTSLDDDLERGRRFHCLPTGNTLRTHVKKVGKTVVSKPHLLFDPKLSTIQANIYLDFFTDPAHIKWHRLSQFDIASFFSRLDAKFFHWSPYKSSPWIVLARITHI